MPGPAVRLLVAAVACVVFVVFIAGTVASAQKQAEWPLHTALEGDQRPFLCRERDSVNLIVQIMARSFDARASDSDKAQRLLEIAGRLQGELCTRPAADDIIILRCSLAQRGVPADAVSVLAYLFAEALHDPAGRDGGNSRNGACEARARSAEAGHGRPGHPLADPLVHP